LHGLSPGVGHALKFCRSVIVLLLCLPLLLAGRVVPAATFEVSEGEGRFDVSGHFQHALDPSGELTFTDIRDGRGPVFSAPTGSTLAFGYVDATYWLRIDLASGDDHETAWLLELTGLARSIDEIDAYVPQADGSVRRFVAGDRVPFTLRSVKHHAVLFPLSLPPGESRSVYLRLRTNGTLQIPAVLWSTAQYAEVEHNDYLMEGIFYGTLLVMIFYNAFVYSSVRDRSYLYYVGYLICVLFFATSLKGIGFEYVWPESPLWNNKANLFFAGAGVLMMLLFAQDFLRISRHSQRLDVAVKGLMLASVMVLPLIFVLSHRWIASGLAVIYLASVPVMIVASVMTLRRGYTAARFYLLAWAGILVTMALWVMNSFSIINSSWIGAYSFQVSVASQVILFSFALADRINLLRREREEALTLQLAQSRKLVSMAKMFEKFVPRQFLSRIAQRGIENIELGKAEDDVITVYFADIRGFTPLSEKMSPQHLLNFLNAYFTRMDRVIHQHNGFIDKFIGDAVMAIFEDNNQQQGATNAVLAAVEMHAAVERYNEHRAKSGYQPISIGVGINTGSVIIGTVGSQERMDSTVLGDNVNIAARLQDMTKMFGVRIIISEQTFMALDAECGIHVRELGDVRVRGRAEPVKLYEVLNADPQHLREAKLSTLPTHRVALECYRRGEWAWARMLWEDCLARHPGDSVYRHMVEQCDLHLVQPLAEESA
jgi:class 3 adenylate cyclase